MLLVLYVRYIVCSAESDAVSGGEETCHRHSEDDGDGDDSALLMLSNRKGGVPPRLGCVADDPGARLVAFRKSFENEGIMIRINGNPTGGNHPVSTTIIRNDIPFTMYTDTAHMNPEGRIFYITGIVYQPVECPDTPKVICAYSNDAFSSDRPPNPEYSDAKCSKFPGFPRSGACNFTSPEVYAHFYTTPPYDETIHRYGKGLCYSNDLHQMLQSQVALYNAMASSTTFPFPGPPLYNEQQSGPYPQAGVLGLIWAHPGPFIDTKSEAEANGGMCAIRTQLGQINYTLPAFELAHVKPWMTQLFDAAVYQETLSAMVARNKDGGYRAPDVIRLVNMTLLREVECSWPFT